MEELDHPKEERILKKNVTLNHDKSSSQKKTSQTNCEFVDEKPSELPQFSMKTESRKSRIIFNLAHANNNVINNQLLNQKLLEKIKQIKNLERELKDKNSLVDKQNNKIEKQQEEIRRLSDKLAVRKA